MEYIDVYSGDDCKDFFSKDVKRDFGENRVVVLDSGETVFSCVMKLRVVPEEVGLKVVGKLVKSE